MKYGQALVDYCTRHRIGEGKLDYDTFELVFEFTERDLHKFRELGFLFEGFHGGLVLGNLHSNEGVQLIKPMEDGKYRHIGEMEGWEYLSSPMQWLKTKSAFEYLNREKLWNDKEDTSFEIPSSCKIIDTEAAELPIILLDENFSHFIINRYATRKYITKIVALDRFNVQVNDVLNQISEDLRI